jgi:hypothetical protein
LLKIAATNLTIENRGTEKMDIHSAENTEQLFDKLHEMSMDKESPTRAANGRACKTFLNALEMFLADERSRHTTLDNLITATLSSQLTVLVTVLQYVPPQFRDAEASRVALTLIEGLLAGVKQSVDIELAAAEKRAAS